MAAMKRTLSTEEARDEAVAAAERNPSYRFHDAVIIVSVFAVYGMFLFYGRNTPTVESET